MRAEEKRDKTIVEQSKDRGKVLSGAASLATGIGGAAVGSALVSRMVPLLSRFIPAGLAAKGLAKLDPRLGNYLKGIFSSGFTIDEGLDYLRENISPENPDVQKYNQLQKGYQDMQQGISEMQSQLNPEGPSPQAGPSTGHYSPYPKGNMINKMLGDNQQGTQTNAPSMMSTQDSGDMRGAQQPGQGQQRLMAAIQQLRQLRGG